MSTNKEHKLQDMHHLVLITTLQTILLVLDHKLNKTNTLIKQWHQQDLPAGHNKPRIQLQAVLRVVTHNQI